MKLPKPKTFSQEYLLCLVIVIITEILFEPRSFIAIFAGQIGLWGVIALLTYWSLTALFFAIIFHFIFRAFSPAPKGGHSS